MLYLQNNMPSSIILISDPKVLQIPIIENNDPLVDLSAFLELQVDTAKSKASVLFFKIRKSVALKLVEAQNRLPQGLKLLIVEGYRPLSLQREYFDEYSHELAATHPDWDSDKIYKEASKYIAPPDIIPPHSTGGAVDLTLVDAEGRDLDMGTEVNANPEESNNACFMLAHNISEAARKNRSILAYALLQSGFVNYGTEWWHWSYGDRYWAFQSNKPAALFGTLE